MSGPCLKILATGGTIAGKAGSATRRGYRPGQVGIAAMMAEAEALDLGVRFDGVDIAAVGSQDIGWAEWQAIHAQLEDAYADDEISGVIVTHGTDTAEETAYLLDLTLPAGKPVVLVGAMRPADAVGTDGMRNFANAVRVAGDGGAAQRGVLVVMSDAVYSAADVRKAATANIEAFRGFPRGPLGIVTPTSLDWFGPPDRCGAPARFAWPEALPPVAIIYAHAGMDARMIELAIEAGSRGIVLAGLGQGNAPGAVIAALAEARRQGIAVVRSSRVDLGSVDRDLEVDDAALGFVAARSLNPQKARILLQLMIASGIADPLQMQAEFDRR